MNMATAITIAEGAKEFWKRIGKPVLRWRIKLALKRIKKQKLKEAAKVGIALLCMGSLSTVPTYA